MLPDVFKRYIEAGSFTTAAEELAILALDPAFEVRMRVAENSHTPVASLAALAHDSSEEVRIALSENPFTPEAVLSFLAADENPDVRFALAENANLPKSILEELVQDENPFVAQRSQLTLRHLLNTVRPNKVVAKGERSQASKSIRVLLIEDNPADAKLLRQILLGSTVPAFTLSWGGKLADGIRMLEASTFDVILLDLALPDAQGMDGFRTVHSRFPNIPIIVLTGLDDQAVALEAVALEAQDYLVKGQIPGGLLIRAISYALERSEALEKIKQLNGALEERIIQLAASNRELEKAGRISQLSRDQAIQASNFKSQFVARMSHEIRTPIAALISVIDLLKAEGEISDSKELLRMAEESAHCLLDVINDVLDLSKIEAGKIELQISDFAPVSLVEDVADLFAAAAQKKNMQILTFIDPEIPALLQGDALRLRQILLNFVSNALKFTDCGEICLRATLESQDQETVALRFSVSDTGCGIAQHLLESLFQPFVQLDKESGKGTGLGLSICKQLIELMGGQIGVQSMAGKGSTFWIGLNLKRSPVAPVARPFHFEQVRSLLKDSRVLVVAGNATAREIMHRYVCAAGLRNGSAANANEALAMLRRAEQIDDPYRLALVDLNCSQAQELAREINEDPSISSIQLLYVADCREGSKQGKVIWSAGFSGYLPRPLRQADLIDTVVDLLCKARHCEPSIEAGEEFADNEFVEVKSPHAVKVLLAEDSEVISRLVIKQLGRLGIAVKAVANGREAITAFAAERYSLILMDNLMPEMNGVEAAKAIRALESTRGSHTPIIALTAQAMPGDREISLAAGMDDYLTKPVTIEQLKQIMQRWLPRESSRAAHRTDLDCDD